MTIIDDAMVVLAGLGFESKLVQTQPGFSGFLATSENGVSGYFVWSHSNSDDYQFRIARFWRGDVQEKGYVDHNLISAISRAKNLLTSI
jgi:hypothetical protein